MQVDLHVELGRLRAACHSPEGLAPDMIARSPHMNGLESLLDRMIPRMLRRLSRTGQAIEEQDVRYLAEVATAG